MTQAIVPKELLTATPGGLSLLVVSGGSDGHVLTQQADGSYAPEAPSAASGDVVGPSSATDNAIARFDTTTGKLLQNSGASISDAGVLTSAKFTSTYDAGGFNAAQFCGPNSTVLYMDQYGQVALSDATKSRFAISGVSMHLPSDGEYGISSGNVFGTIDVKLSRNSTGPTWHLRAAGGIRSRNIADSADAPITGSVITASGAWNLAPITKTALLLLTPTASSAGRWRVTDATPANREAYPDGTNWRYTSDDVVVT